MLSDFGFSLSLLNEINGKILFCPIENWGTNTCESLCFELQNANIFIFIVTPFVTPVVLCIR